jgi:TPP-dependent pyruvate/acetoin dehydrogenase alpha subunit
MMLKIRILELEIANRYSDEKMRCPVHLSIGQESNSVAINFALKPSDKVVSGHRAHAHYVAKGGNVFKFIAELYGKPSGCSGGIGGSMHLIDVSAGFEGSTSIVGGTVPVGVGIAKSLKLNGLNNIVGVFIGEAVTETGVFFESFNLAATQKLPTVFFCENNKFSVYTPLKERQSQNRSNQKIVEGLGGAYLSARSIDVEDVYYKSKKAKSMAISGIPVMFEIESHRYLEHCGPNLDDHLDYRDKSDLQFWQENDPIKVYLEDLITSGIYSKSKFYTDITEINSQITQLFDSVENERDFSFSHDMPLPRESIV